MGIGNVLLSSGARHSVSEIRNISQQIAKVQRTIATGNRVNSPTDDPAAYFTSAALRTRAGDIKNLLTTMGTAQSTVAAANTGIETIEGLLNSARSLAAEALESGEDLVVITGSNSSPMTTNTQIASTFGSASRFRAGDVVTVSDGTTTATYTAVNGDTLQDFLDDVNNTNNLEIEASLNASGQLVLEATSNVNITVGATLAGAGTVSSVLSINTGTTSYTVDAVRTAMATQVNSIRTQIDQAVSDASFNGVNLLTGDTLTVQFNESGSSSLSITGANMTSTGLGLAAATNSFQLDSDIEAAIDDIDAALVTLQVQSSVMSSNLSIVEARQTFATSMVETLTAGADELIAADVNEESALLLALQSRQQMAGIALSVTQGADTTALRIFGVSF